MTGIHCIEHPMIAFSVNFRHKKWLHECFLVLIRLYMYHAIILMSWCEKANFHFRLYENLIITAQSKLGITGHIICHI